MKDRIRTGFLNIRKVLSFTGKSALRLVTLLPCAAVVAFGAVPASGAEIIRVAIADDQRTVTVQPSAGLSPGGKPARRSGEKRIISAASAGARPVRIGSRSGSARVNGKEYRGTVELRRNANGLLLVVNELDIEDYLKGVIAAEIPHEWETEALEAQAVASRTYALFQKKNAGRSPYHIRATVDSQVYLGVSGERPRAVQAVKATEGLVITYNGQVIAAFYHSSCGGHTEDSLELWAIDAPYLRGVDCDCQQISTYGLWEKRFPKAEISGALRREGYRLGEIMSVSAGDITPAGRVKNVIFRNLQGALSVPAETLRSALGYSSIPSIFFEPELSGDDVVFSGRGLGHGVGLCQWGAKEMARRGQDFAAIIAHYYPGTEIVRMNGAGLATAR
jgi:stage II sporulation protein D